MRKKYNPKNRSMQIILLITFLSTLTLFQINSVTATTELQFWYVEEDGSDDTMLTLIGTFESAHTGITVNATRVDIEELKDLYKEAFLNGQAPDIVQGPSTWIAELVTNNMLHSIADESFLTEFMPEALRAVSYYEIENDIVQGDSLLYYGFPQYVDAQAFVYNKELAAGATIPSIDGSWTSEEFFSAIVNMNDQSDPENKEYGISFGDMPNSAEPLFYGLGGLKFSDYTVDSSHIQIEANASIDALDFIYKIVNVNRLTPEYTTTETPENSVVLQNFATDGNVLSTFAFASDISDILDGAQFLDDSNLGYAPIPQDAIGNGGPLQVMALMINSGLEGDILNSTIELAQHMTSSESIILNAENEILLPPSWVSFEDPGLMELDIIQGYKTILEQATQEPISKYWETLDGSLKTELLNMVTKNQIAEITARGIAVRWGFALPTNQGYPPINPYTGDQTSTGIAGYNSVYFLGFLGIGMSIVLLRKKKEKL